MYPAQVLRYDTIRAIYVETCEGSPGRGQLSTFCVIWTDFTIVYQKRGFKLTAFSDSNWGNNPDNGKSTS